MDTFNSIETDEYILLFQRIKEELLFSGIAKKKTDSEYVLVEVEEFSKVVRNLLTDK